MAGMNRKELLEALSVVRPGLASKEIVEQSCSFVFDGGRVCTYNDEIAVSHPVPEGISGAVRAGELFSLLSKFPDEEIGVEVTESELVVSGKKRKAGIALQSKIKIPLDALKAEKEWKPLPEGFGDALEFCGMSVGQDMTKPLLTCIHVKGEMVESCDNHRIGRWTLAQSVPDELLIMGTAAKRLLSYKATEYAVSKEWAHFRNEAQAVFSVRVFEGQYPDLSKFLAVEGFRLELPTELPEILERAEVMMEEVDGTAEIALAEKHLTVRTKGPVGWFEEDARVRYDGEPVSFRIPPRFLREISGRLRSVEVCGGLLKFQGDNFVHACSTVASG